MLFCWLSAGEGSSWHPASALYNQESYPVHFQQTVQKKIKREGNKNQSLAVKSCTGILTVLVNILGYIVKYIEKFFWSESLNRTSKVIQQDDSLRPFLQHSVTEFSKSGGVH